MARLWAKWIHWWKRTRMALTSCSDLDARYADAVDGDNDTNTVHYGTGMHASSHHHRIAARARHRPIIERASLNSFVQFQSFDLALLRRHAAIIVPVLLLIALDHHASIARKTRRNSIFHYIWMCDEHEHTLISRVHIIHTAQIPVQRTSKRHTLPHHYIPLQLHNYELCALCT